MAKLIGTAGHVDHGKTTLIQALTGIDADRLPEEKRRGMTIDVGYAFINLPRHGKVSIVDVPGHEKFLRNMLVGALGVDLALLCVAADEGVKPQTREHFQILELLPVERMVVALTRADLADEVSRELCREDTAVLLKGSRFEGCPIIEVSAETGEGLGGLVQALDAGLDDTGQPPSGPWYLPIDRVFSVKGHGSVVTGTMARGTVHSGDTAILMPTGQEARIRSIQWHGEQLESAAAGQRAALNLSGLKLEDVERGQAIGEPGSLFESQIVDAKVRWISRPRHGSRVRVSLGADEAIARVFLSDQDSEFAQLRFERAIACALDQPLIVRRYSPPELLGGGKVVVPVAIKRRKSEALGETARGSSEQEILAVLETQPEGIVTEEICRRLGKSQQALGDAFERLSHAGQARGFGGFWFTAENFDRASERLLNALDRLHDRAPLVAYQPREKAVEAARLKWTGKALDRIIGALATSGKIEATGTNIKKAGFRIQLTERQRNFLDRVKAEILSQDVNTPHPAEIAARVQAPPQAVEEILKLGQQAGEIRNIGEDIWFAELQIGSIKTRLEKSFASRPFSIAELRDALGTTRKYAVPIAEYLDRAGFTTRIGDKRLINVRKEAE